MALAGPEIGGAGVFMEKAAREAKEPAADGWACAVDAAGPGTDYAFRLDGGPPRPDPGRFQPDGIDGPLPGGRPRRFPLDRPAVAGPPLAEAVLHELPVGTFSAEGTCDGAIGHLDHLVDIRIDAVEVWAPPGGGGAAPHYPVVPMFFRGEEWGARRRRSST